MQLLGKIADHLIPATCLACGDLMAKGQEKDDLSLCPRCRSTLEKPEQKCSGCGCPQDQDRCARCLLNPPPWELLVFLWVYAPPLDKVLLALKLRRLDYLGSQLAAHLCRELGAELVQHDIVTDVPLHWSRRLLRGYNQSELLARSLAQGLGLPHGRLLRRRKWSRPQRRLSRRGRLTGPRGVFEANEGLLQNAPRVLLVDDVITTGATLASATRACLEAGAAAVTAVVAARTPLPGEVSPDLSRQPGNA
jgi:ComF family protein